MTEDTLDRRDYRFWIGLLAGTAIGAGVVMWVLPRVAETVDELTKKGQGLRHDVARTIVRGAHQAERLATVIEGSPIATANS